MGMVVLKMSYPDYKDLHDLIDSFTDSINTVHLGFSPKLTPNMSPIINTRHVANNMIIIIYILIITVILSETQPEC